MKTRIKIAVIAIIGVSYSVIAQKTYNENVRINGSLYVANTPGNNGEVIHIRNTQATGTNQSFGGIKFSSAPGFDWVLGKFSDGGTGKFQIRDQANTERFTILPSGNVGIGVSNPQTPLDVKGIIKSTDGNGNVLFSSADANGSYMRAFGSQNINFRNTAGSSMVNFNVTNGSATFKGNVQSSGFFLSDTYRNLSSDAMLMYENNKITLGSGNPIQHVAIKSGGQDRIFVKKDGNVGIGTATPNEKLEFGGDSKMNIRLGRWATLGTTGGGIATIIGNNVKASQTVNNRIEYITSTNDGAKAIKMQYNEGITFHTFLGAVTANEEFLGYERMRIDNNGNVGIGIPNPSVKLHVNDGQVLIQPENNNESGILKINEYRGGSLLDFSEVGDAGFLKVGYYGLNGDRVEINGGVSNAGSAVVGYDDGNIKFKLASRGTSFIEGGGLAIGTNMVPTGFDFAVAGKTITEEVKVQLKRDWPDFVFENSYQLPTLTEVENHIKTKGHLKDIPSAKEVETNGFYLGEMDAKLLQKIEELTLYTIEQEKKINSQTKEIESLKSQQERIDKLEKENKVLKTLLEKVNQLEKLINKN
ncbi:hypothetical protein [Tenacibaculum xiamenense]|uniref:hypothetical protein n=1 Tax=Tenacibaculum xiamenense TaxID=1261553 RepID=UPI0038946804